MKRASKLSLMINARCYGEETAKNEIKLQYLTGSNSEKISECCTEVKISNPKIAKAIKDNDPLSFIFKKTKDVWCSLDHLNLHSIGTYYIDMQGNNISCYKNWKNWIDKCEKLVGGGNGLPKCRGK